MTIQPGEYHLNIIQGATFDEVITWKDATGAPVPFTGYTARAQARPDINSPTILMDISTANGGIVLGATDGKINLKMSAAATASITVESGIWDLELVAPTGTVTRLLQGKVFISKEVTR